MRHPQKPAPMPPTPSNAWEIAHGRQMLAQDAARHLKIPQPRLLALLAEHKPMAEAAEYEGMRKAKVHGVHGVRGIAAAKIQHVRERVKHLTELGERPATIAGRLGIKAEDFWALRHTRSRHYSRKAVAS